MGDVVDCDENYLRASVLGLMEADDLFVILIDSVDSY